MKNEEFRYSERVIFRKGDKMRVSSGPYYPSKDGKKVSMGECGVYIFSHVDEQGHVWATSIKRKTLCLIYVGEEYVSDRTGTVMRPHKLRKIRKKKKKT